MLYARCWVLEKGSWVSDLAHWVLKPGGWVIKHGHWGWVLKGVMLGALCCFGSWLCSGLCKGAQHRALSDTYRLWHTACGEGAQWPEGMGCPGLPRGSAACPGVPHARRCQLAAGQELWGSGDTHLTSSPLPQSIQEFHEDLFPDCTGTLPATSAQAWWAGDNQQVSVTRGGVPISGITRGYHHSLPTTLATNRWGG